MALPVFDTLTRNGTRPTLGLLGELLWVTPESIDVDETYQRTLSAYQVNRIIREWDPDLLGVVYISERGDGSRFVMDGQHRLEAIRRMGMGDQLVPAMVYTHLTLETEAKIFAKMNKNRLYLPPQYAFRARLVAKDPVALNLRETVESYGFHINFWKMIPGEPSQRMWEPEGMISAVGELERLTTSYSPGMLDAVLDLAHDAWGDQVIGLGGTVLRGLAAFLYQYQERMDRDRVLEVLEKYSPTRLLGDGRDHGTRVGGTANGILRAIVERYNFHLGADKKLPTRGLRKMKTAVGPEGGR